MSERYLRLFTLPENLYTVGSPVIIAAGTLLKDNQTGNIVAQLKLQSISTKAIKAVKVKLYLFDTAGNSLGESVVHDYLDLNVSRDNEFAQKNPVLISNSKARSYNVSVAEVVFGDQTVWTSSIENWEPLSQPSLLVFDDPELRKQYEIKFGRDSVYEPKKEKDLWYCTCGTINHDGEMCHTCHNTLSALQNVDMKKLEKDKISRLQEETKQAEAKRIAEDTANKERAKKTKIIASIACAVLVVVFLISNVFIPMRNRNALIKEYGKEYVDGLKDLQVGDTVLFGKYEQDNNKSNGSERIQWVVLKRDGNKALVISRYALDCKPYNTTEEKVTWETCTLRSWLNSTFVNAAFSDAEKSLIPTVTVSADRNPDEDTDPGKATKDKVFLLSVTEANRYFSSNAERVCQYTEYACLAAGYNYATAYYDDCCWWLRTPGWTAKQAAQVWWYMDGVGKIPATPSGSLRTYGQDVEDEDFVRPAMWIDLKP